MRTSPQPLRVGINGFGRIGRNVVRAALRREASPIELVAVNDLSDVETLAYLLRHDSVHGRLGADLRCADDALVIEGAPVKVLAERSPAKLPWDDLGVDLVIESTGLFRTRERAGEHIEAGASWAIISAPSPDPDLTLLVGVNDAALDPRRQQVISNASCTTNCAAVMAAVLVRNFGVEELALTTVHAYTGDQALVDAPHKDPRRGRAAALNIVPSETGAAKALAEVLPSLAGRVQALALRVPVPDGAMTDLAVILERPASPAEINAAFRDAAASGPLAGVLEATDVPLVSADVLGNPHSAVVDLSLTTSHGRLAKIFGWYDNEWGYSNRLVDAVGLVRERVGEAAAA